MKQFETFQLSGFKIMLPLIFCLSILIMLLADMKKVQAQQMAVFTQYREHQNFVNPASVSPDYLTYRKNLNAGIAYRYQWIGFGVDEAPNTAIGSFDYISEQRNMLVGGYILQDQTGPTGLTGIYGRYGYQIELGGRRDLFLSMGLAAGVVQYRIDGERLQFEDGDVVQGRVPSLIKPDFSAGFMLYGDIGNNKFYTGVSVPQLLGLELELTNEVDPNGALKMKRIQHFYGVLGTLWGTGQQGYIEPSVWVKYSPNSKLNVDVNVRQMFRDLFWVGLGASSSGALHADVGVVIKQGENQNILKIGYGVGYGLSQYNSFFGTVHEINVSYAWEKY